MKKIALGGIIGIFILVLSFFLSQKELAPLSQYIQKNSVFQNLKANFLTENISPYSGFLSASLQSCMADTEISGKNTLVKTYNEKANITQSKDEIIAEISPVFGEAIKNNNINWIWNKELKQYTFIFDKKDSALWTCYFANETDFFSKFFVPEKVIPTPTPTPTSSIPPVNTTFPTPTQKTINTLTYDAFPIIERITDGHFIMIYYSGVHHPGKGAGGVMKMRETFDAGNTWSEEKIIIKEDKFDIRGPSFGVGYNNRLILTYVRYLDIDSSHLGTRYIYSDDLGKTWSTPKNFVGGFPYGKIVKINNNELLSTVYSSTGVYVMKSSDNGTTWGNRIRALVGGDYSNIKNNYYNEANFVHIGEGKIIGLVRQERGSHKTFRQIKSSDNGKTWVDQGDVTFDDWEISGPPWINLHKNKNGESIIELYYVDRSEGKLKYINGNADYLFRLGSSEWNDVTLTSVIDVKKGLSGYPSFVKWDDVKNIVAFYEEDDQSDADLKILIDTPEREDPTLQ